MSRYPTCIRIEYDPSLSVPMGCYLSVGETTRLYVSGMSKRVKSSNSQGIVVVYKLSPSVPQERYWQLRVMMGRFDCGMPKRVNVSRYLKDTPRRFGLLLSVKVANFWPVEATTR